MSDELDKSLIDGFQAASVMLAFAAVVFAVRYLEIQEDLALQMPHRDQPANLNKYRSRLRETVRVKVLPMLVFFWIFAVLLLPASIQVIMSIDWTPSHYDFIRFAWFLTNVLLFVFAIWTTGFAQQLQVKIKKEPQA